MAKRRNLNRRGSGVRSVSTSNPQTPAARAQSQKAASLIEAGDFDAAEAILEELDPVKSRDATALHLLGLAKVRKGRYQEGMSMLDRSILAEPGAGWMRVNRAAVLQGKGLHEAAVADLEAAVKVAPGVAAAWSNLAASRSILGDHSGAAAAAKRAAKLAPDNPAALVAYGNTLNRAERYEEAADVYQRALRAAPDNLVARVGALQALQKLGRADEAHAQTEQIASQLGARVESASHGAAQSVHIDRAIASELTEAMDADAVLAMAMESIGQFEQALAAAERACDAAPNDARGWAVRGILLYRLERHDEAVDIFRRALSLRPDWPEILGGLGNVFWSLERSAEAEEVLSKATELAPGQASLWATLGAARRDLRDLAGSEAAYAKAVELAPKNGSYGLSLALAQIRQKKFQEGYANYERRWETDGFADQVRPHAYPIWDGGDLTGKKILVYAEQGVGDEVMATALLHKLTDMGAAVYLESNGRLVDLFDRSFPGVIVGPSQNPSLPAFTSPDFDCQIQAGALMSRLAPTYDDLRPSGAYLKADPARVAELRKRYREPMPDGAAPKLVVGFAWRSGNPVTGGRRSAMLEHWSPVLEQPGVRFVNLQYGDCGAELAAARSATGAEIVDDADIDADGPLDDFAAQVAALDVVVSIDNSAIHFAGALGVPTLMLLNYEPDWRWFGAEEGNPWYESVAHVRQDAPGAWAPVMEAAASVVADMAAGGPPPAMADPLRPVPPRPMANHGARPRALLFNDTTAWYHWGCTATSLAIREQIAARGYDIEATPIRAIYQARPAPPSIHDFDDDRFFDAFVAANPQLMRQLQDADRIVVNGEGTMHGLSENVRALLYLCYVAARRLDKPVQIINHSCYPEDAPRISDPISNGLYRKVYAQVEYAAFREHVTLGLMAKLGIEGALAFDSLPLTARRFRPDANVNREKRLVIAGSASADDAAAGAFAEYARWASAQGWTTVLLCGARAFPAADETRFVQALARHGMPPGTELVNATSLEAWLGEIGRAGLVSTGRFHHSIAAFALGAPFLAASSNTAKTHALMELLERPAPLQINAPNLAAQLIDAHGAALDGREDAAAHAARREAVESLAMENFARL